MKTNNKECQICRKIKEEVTDHEKICNSCYNIQESIDLDLWSEFDR